MTNKAQEQQGQTQEVRTADLWPGACVLRKSVSEEHVAALAESIARNGLINPITVRAASKDGKHYEILAGFCRWRAVAALGWEMAPVRLVDPSEEGGAQLLALAENLDREALSPIEEGRAYMELMEETGWQQGEMAARVGRSVSHVAACLKAATLPEEWEDLLASGIATSAHVMQAIAVEYFWEPEMIEALWTEPSRKGEVRGGAEFGRYLRGVWKFEMDAKRWMSELPRCVEALSPEEAARIYWPEGTMRPESPYEETRAEIPRTSLRPEVRRGVLWGDLVWVDCPRKRWVIRPDGGRPECVELVVRSEVRAHDQGPEGRGWLRRKPISDSTAEDLERAKAGHVRRLVDSEVLTSISSQWLNGPEDDRRALLSDLSAVLIRRAGRSWMELQAERVGCDRVHALTDAELVTHFVQAAESMEERMALLIEAAVVAVAGEDSPADADGLEVVRQWAGIDVRKLRKEAAKRVDAAISTK